jgi:hypothetical protein
MSKYRVYLPAATATSAINTIATVFIVKIGRSIARLKRFAEAKKM